MAKRKKKCRLKHRPQGAKIINKFQADRELKGINRLKRWPYIKKEKEINKIKDANLFHVVSEDIVPAHKMSSLEQEGGCENPKTLTSRPPGPFTTMRSALSTAIAVQEHYASNEGLAMMHMKHAVPIGGAIVHLCLDQWCTSGALYFVSSLVLPLSA